MRHWLQCSSDIRNLKLHDILHDIQSLIEIPMPLMGSPAEEDRESDDIAHYLRCPQLEWLMSMSLEWADQMSDTSRLIGINIKGFDPQIIPTMFMSYHGFKLGSAASLFRFPTLLSQLENIEQTVCVIARSSLYNARQVV